MKFCKIFLAIRYPWVAFLQIFMQENVYGCTGSLIDDQTILTAAHCIEEDDHQIQPEKIMVFLGITSIDDAYGNLALDVEKIYAHPERNITLYENDVALLRLKEPVKFVRNIRPICLPMNRDESVFGEMKVAGFGRLSVEKLTADLQEANVDFVDRDTCAKKLFNYRLSLGMDKGHLMETALCGKGKDRTMICHGDSGGPLMHSNRDGRMVVAGISQGNFKKCGDDPDVADVYANVGLFIDFVKQHAFGACFRPLS